MANKEFDLKKMLGDTAPVPQVPNLEGRLKEINNREMRDLLRNLLIELAVSRPGMFDEIDMVHAHRRFGVSTFLGRSKHQPVEFENNYVGRATLQVILSASSTVPPPRAHTFSPSQQERQFNRFLEDNGTAGNELCNGAFKTLIAAAESQGYVCWEIYMLGPKDICFVFQPATKKKNLTPVQILQIGYMFPPDNSR